MLAAGLGIAAMTAANVLPLSNAGVSTQADVSLFEYSGVTPASGTVFLDWQNNSVLDVAFTGEDKSSFEGVDVVRSSASPVEIFLKSGEDWGLSGSVWADDTEALKADSRFPTHILINVGDVFKTPGEYKVIIPQGIFKQTNKDAYNPAVELYYSVVSAPQFTTSPKNGQTISTLAGGLSVAKIEFAVGVTLAQGAAYKEGSIVINSVDPSATTNIYPEDDPEGDPIAIIFGKTEEVGSYSMSIDGNVVDLTYVGTEEIANNKSPKYYQIVIPAGTIVANGVTMPEIKIDNLSQTWLDANSIEIVNEDDESFSAVYANATDFPTTFYTILPGPVDFAKKTSYIKCQPSTGSVKNVGIITGTQEGPNLIKWTMNAPGTSPSIVGNPQWWPAGKYTIEIGKESFGDPKKPTQKNSTVITLGTWEVLEGCSVDPLVLVQANLGYTYYASNSTTSSKVVVATESILKGDALDIIDGEVGIACYKLQFLNSCKPNVNKPEASLTITKDGDSEPMILINPSDKINCNHLWNAGTRPTEANRNKANTSNANSWAIYFSDFADMQNTVHSGTNATASNACFLPEFLKTPGTYSVHADQGFFVEATGVESQEVNTTFTILGEKIEYIVAPENNANVDEIKDITITYPEGAVVTVPEGTKLQMQPGQLSSGVNTLPYFNITGEGNVVTLSLDEAYSEVAKYGYKVSIPVGLWSISYNGASQLNEGIELKYILDNVKAGTVTPASNVGGELIPGSDLATIKYVASSKVMSTGKAYLYSVEPGVEGAAPTRTQVASYTGKLPEVSVGSGEYEEQPSVDVTWSTTDDVAMLKTGTYEFVIPISGLTYGAGLQAKEEFSYTYLVEGPVLFADLMTLVDPYKSELYPFECAGGEGLQSMTFEFEHSNIKQADAATLASLEFKLLLDGEELGTWLGNDSSVNTFDTRWNECAFDFGYAKSLQGFPFSTTPGVYTLVIPDGYLTLNGKPVVGASYSITILEVPQEEIDFTYTLDPDSGEKVNSLSTIVLTFPNAHDVMYCSNSNNPLATLENEDKTLVLDCIWGTPSVDMKSITLKFGDESTEWVSGLYTLTIPAGLINLNNPYFDDSDENIGSANFDGLTAIYNLDTNTGVTLIGIDSADSYNVYTLDGKVVRLNAAPADLLELAPGMYLVNGKKVNVVK